MRNSSTQASIHQPPTAITAEGATLPIIRAAGFEARVNAYVVGSTERLLRHTSGAIAMQDAKTSPGCVGGATDLWYLSLVAPRGYGTTLRAIWANLVGNTRHAVSLEGIGMVALGHQRLDLSGPTGLGYPLHWTYRQAIVPPSRDAQAVLESDLLTCYDPLLAPVVTRAPRAARGKATTRQGSKRPPSERAGAATLSTANGNSGDQEDEARARETHPLFLLLARPVPTEMTQDRPVGAESSGRATNDEWLARLHLRYLATRIPWLPYYPAWALYLWRRALANGEAERLHVGSYGSTAVSDAERSVAPGSYLTAAYLCRPDPLALTADLSRTIAAGMFHAGPSATENERAA